MDIFWKQKSDIGGVLSGFLDQLKGLKYKTKFLRCDDAGENTKQLADVCKKHGIKIEHSAPHTTQLNGVVERAVVTLRQCALAMMFLAKFMDEYQGRLWAEAVNTAKVLTNQAANSGNRECPDNLFYGTLLPKLRHPYKHLKEFGRIGHVTICTMLKKLDKKTIKCGILAYSWDHASGAYRMYNLDTNSIIDLRDIKWATWHGSNNLLKSMDKLFLRVPAELPVKSNEQASGDDYQAAEDDEDDLKSIAGPSGKVAMEDETIEDKSDNDTTKQEVGRKETPTTLSTLQAAPNTAPITKPSNFGRKTGTVKPHPKSDTHPRKDVHSRLVKVA